jgi:ferric-dicitrate binding protein FerR (iron transport regulator)
LFGKYDFMTDRDPTKQSGRLKRLCAAVIPKVIAAVITAFILWAGHEAWQRIQEVPGDGTQSVRTDVGARKDVFLPRHSSVTLNTKTDVAVDVHTFSRTVWLNSGEAFFKVNRDPLRGHLLVCVGRISVTDLATSFAIRREGRSVFITVAEGQVDVRGGQMADEHCARGSGTTTDEAGSVELEQPESQASVSFSLNAGNRATLTVDERDIHQHVDPLNSKQIDDALAWREGRVVLDGDIQPGLVEISRYLPQRLVASTSAEKMKLRVTLEPKSEQAVLKALHESHGLVPVPTPKDGDPEALYLGTAAEKRARKSEVSPRSHSDAAQ